MEVHLNRKGYQVSHQHQEPRYYTAHLTSCKRDTHTSSVKCLIIDIYDEDNTLFRDHHWVPLSNELDIIQPKNGKNKKKLIQFTAQQRVYQSSEGPKMGLINLKNIKPIKG